MCRLLERLSGVFCLMDDVIVLRSNQEELNTRLMATLERLEKAEVTLNSQKCEFRKQIRSSLVNVVSAEGISPSPDKTSAISAMPAPYVCADLRRFIRIR